MKNWINNHRAVLIFAAIFALLGLVRFIPPYENIFIWQRFIQAVALVVHGFANFLVAYSRFLPEPSGTISVFTLQFIFGAIYVLELTRLWKWRVWLGKFLALLLILINSLPGLFIVNASDILVGKSYATCRKEISDTVIVRVVAYPEIGWIAGSHQFYLISRDEGKTWHQFMDFRHDDPIRPDCDKIQSRTSNHIWVWTNSFVAVTRNAGIDWHFGDWGSLWVDGGICNGCIVENVIFQDDKNGYIELSPIDGEGEQVLLHTEDGGETWK